MTSGRPAPASPVVTLAALYGAGGSVVGPQVAERLSVPLLDRAIPDAVAEQAGLPEEAVADIDDQPDTCVGPVVAAAQARVRAAAGAS